MIEKTKNENPRIKKSQNENLRIKKSQNGKSETIYFGFFPARKSNNAEFRVVYTL